jgi:hypothetical protein
MDIEIKIHDPVNDLHYGHPVLIPGVADQNITLDSIMALIPSHHRFQNVFESMESSRFKYSRRSTNRHSMDVNEFISRASTHSIYLYGEPLPSSLTSLIPSWPPLHHSSLTSILLWIAAIDTCSPLHYDLCDGILVQLAGTKRVLLFGPEAIPDAAMPDVDDAYDRQSSIDDVHHLDPVQFTKFRKHSAIQAVVRPGDALYIPYGW